MAVDVQKSSPLRLGFEVLAHGMERHALSILYKWTEGDVSDPFAGAWEALSAWMDETQLCLPCAEGRLFPVKIIEIDFGDGHVMDMVYRFCERWYQCLPGEGFSILKHRGKEEIADISMQNFLRFRVIKIVDTEQRLLGIRTEHYKNKLYSALRIERNPGGENKPEFCDFPFDYDEKYFKMLTAEERRVDGSYHQVRNRNGALDIRVYGLAAADFLLDSQVRNLEEIYRRAHRTRPSRVALVVEFLRKLKKK